MNGLRALLLASLLGVMAIAACGGAGSGGGAQTAAPTNPAPALGTNNPSSPKPSGDPYSDYGY
jgi:hypothetical protein